MDDVKEIVEDFEEPKSKSVIAPPEQAAASATGSVAAVAGEIVEHIGRRRWLI